MKQYDLDVWDMRVERICSNMTDAVCLLRAWAELSVGNAGYLLKCTDCSTLAFIVVKYFNRIQQDIVGLKDDFEFPPSSRHRA